MRWLYVFLLCPLETLYPWEKQYPYFSNPLPWPLPLGGVGLLLKNFYFYNAFLVGGFEGGIAVGQFRVAGNKLFEHCLTVDVGTGNIAQCVVQLR